MATITSIKSGKWGYTSTWDTGTVPVNGDNVIIAEGHQVEFNVDQSGFANGLAGLTINGILYWNNGVITCLKMNGNITGTGRLYVAGMWEMDPVEYEYDPVPGYPNVWSDTGIAAIETLAGVRFTPVDSIAEVNATPNSIYQVREEGSLITYWNDAESVNRYFTGINRPPVGSEYRAYILFNSTGTINVPYIQMYGWYPEREYTQLSANASAGQNQIVLTDDLGLQQGDKIMVSSQTVTNFVESNKGIFAVTAYEPETKTVTLSPTIGDNRLEGDYVSLFSRPITLKRISGTTPFCNANFDASVIATGVKVYGCNLLGNSDYGTSLGEWNGCEFYHCSAEKSLIYPGKNCKFEDCNSGINSYGLGNGMYNTYTRCITTTAFMCYGGAGNRIEDCIQSNSTYISGRGMVTNSIFLNNKTVFYSGNSGEYVTNSIIHSNEVVSYLTISCPLDSKAINCVFKDNTVGYFRSGGVISLFNCLFEGKEIHDDACLYEHAFIESFDHNQIPGNYRAWCKGGTIETDFDGETPLPGHLIFNCESADYPVFRDYKFYLPERKSKFFKAGFNKDFNGGTVKLQLINPTSDPLIDPSSTPIIEKVLPDVKDSDRGLEIRYRPPVPGEYILRILCQAPTGTVRVNTRWIEQMR